jgi:hypothetical protein
LAVIWVGDEASIRSVNVEEVAFVSSFCSKLNLLLRLATLQTFIERALVNAPERISNLINKSFHSPVHLDNHLKMRNSSTKSIQRILAKFRSDTETTGTPRMAPRMFKWDNSFGFWLKNFWNFFD